MTKKAILEIHDISPFFKTELQKLKSFLANFREERVTLLVIPNYRHEYPLEACSETKRLVEEVRGEIVLHGYSHFGKRKISQILLTWGEAEFSSLTLDQTLERIRKGKEILHLAGLRTNFFVPPAWVFNPYVEEAAKSLGFRGVAGRLNAKCLETGKKIFVPALALSTRKILAEGSLALLKLLRLLFSPLPYLRVAIHMREFRSAGRIKLWSRLCRVLKEKRRFICYEELLS